MKVPQLVEMCLIVTILPRWYLTPAIDSTSSVTAQHTKTAGWRKTWLGPDYSYSSQLWFFSWEKDFTGLWTDSLTNQAFCPMHSVNSPAWLKQQQISTLCVQKHFLWMCIDLWIFYKEQSHFVCPYVHKGPCARIQICIAVIHLHYCSIQIVWERREDGEKTLSLMSNTFVIW